MKEEEKESNGNGEVSRKTLGHEGRQSMAKKGEYEIPGIPQDKPYGKNHRLKNCAQHLVVDSPSSFIHMGPIYKNYSDIR